MALLVNSVYREEAHMMHQIIDPFINFDDETDLEDFEQNTLKFSIEIAVNTPKVRYVPATPVQHAGDPAS
jgi:hypothetical protein